MEKTRGILHGSQDLPTRDKISWKFFRKFLSNSAKSTLTKTHGKPNLHDGDLDNKHQ